MRRDVGTVLLWALFLAGLTGAQFVFMSEEFSYGLLGGAALATVLLGAYLGFRGGRDADVRVLPDLSYATVALAVGFSVAVLGAPFGSWLFLPALGVAALGLGGVVRERLALRRRVRP